MNLNWPRVFLLVLMQSLFFYTASAQSKFDLCFRGLLADIEGEKIPEEHFDLKVQVSKVSAYEILYEFNTATYTDSGGWFGFIIPRMSQFLMEGNELSHPVEIRMEILPNKDTKWVREGEDFMVSYSLKPGSDDAENKLIMTRMEGSELEGHSEEHLCAFKDLDPFAYLLGGFLITDEPPFKNQSLLDLQQWLSPDQEDEEGETSRGVKGGFPSGGYYKKK